MSWVRISLDDVLAYADRARIDAVLATTTPAEEGGWFEVIRDSVVSRIRTKVGQRCAIDEDAALIPPEFAELAALLCLSQVLSRIGQIGTTAEGSAFTLTSEQRDRIRALEADLTAVAKGDLSVTGPDNPDATPNVSGFAVELASTPVVRVLGRSGTSGL